MRRASAVPRKLQVDLVVGKLVGRSIGLSVGISHIKLDIIILILLLPPPFSGSCLTWHIKLDIIILIPPLPPPIFRRLSYVTYQDIRSVGNFADQTVMAVKAPPDTRLEVPDPKQSLQIWLKSQNGAIEVCLVGLFVCLFVWFFVCLSVRLVGLLFWMIPW